MSEDIRNKPSISHSDVVALNFVKSATPYVFRRHFRQGLRSHVMEVLHPDDVKAENTGTIIEGVRWFPQAVPGNVFRIFRSRFKTVDEVWVEVERVRMVSHYLAPDFMAHSSECIVEYHGPHGPELMLCGFQQYIDGEIIDPWTILDSAALLPSLYKAMCARKVTMSRARDEWVAGAREKGLLFIEKIKSMMTRSGHIPDLAGVGNLIITPNGEICLVDINNISPVSDNSTILLDEKGYPVFDKSVEALSLIEEKIVGRPIDMGEKFYKLLLGEQRKRMVEEKVEIFWKEYAAK